MRRVKRFPRSTIRGTTSACGESSDRSPTLFKWKPARFHRHAMENAGRLREERNGRVAAVWVAKLGEEIDQNIRQDIAKSRRRSILQLFPSPFALFVSLLHLLGVRLGDLPLHARRRNSVLFVSALHNFPRSSGGQVNGRIGGGKLVARCFGEQRATSNKNFSLQEYSVHIRTMPSTLGL